MSIAQKRILVIISVVCSALLTTLIALAAVPSVSVMNLTILGGNIAQPGDVVTYRIGVLNNTGVGQTLLITDALPTGVKLIDKPTINLLQGSNPTNVVRDIRDGVIGFKGDFQNGTAIEMLLPVRVGRCFTNSNKQIFNQSFLTQNGATTSADATLNVNCTNATTLDDLTVDIEITDDPKRSPGSAEAYNGQFVRLNFLNSGLEPLDLSVILPNFGQVGVDHDYHLTEWLTCVRGTEVETIETVEGEQYEFELPTNMEISMEFYIEHSDETIDDQLTDLTYQICLPDFDQAACLLENNPPEQVLEETVSLNTRRRDLGDAPDSSNHGGVAMLAYAGVNASFPTVHDTTLPGAPGPVHINSGRFHLGVGVSAEFEADTGPDQDFINNIEPGFNLANLDLADDGVLPASWSFSHCTATTIPVQVFIHPDAVAAFGANPGYINIWVDSNRDGDWADAVNCGGTTSPEHIVIDAPVDVATLGPGLHTINVNTTLVPWLAGQANNPAWARVMLNGTPSVKLAGQSYGDGRGRALPYFSGETEDYIINDPMQLMVNPNGNFGSPDGDGAPVNWRVRFRNQDEGNANNFTLDINLPNQTVEQVYVSNDALNCSPDGSGLMCSAANLPSGADGTVGIRTKLGSGNSATLNVTADSSNTTASSASSTVIGPQNDLYIVSPLNGTISADSEAIDIKLNTTDSSSRNAADPIEVAWDGIPLGTFMPTSNDLTVPLTQALRTPGRHILTVRQGDSVEYRAILVDASIGFDPASILLTDSATGVVYSPRYADGRLDAGGFNIPFQNGVPLEISLRAENVANIRVRYADGTIYPLTPDPNDANRYVGTLNPPVVRAFPFIEAAIEMLDNNGLETVMNGAVFNLPTNFFFVRDAVDGSPITNATVNILRDSNDLRLSNSGVSGSGWRDLGSYSAWSDIMNYEAETDLAGSFPYYSIIDNLAVSIQSPGHQGINDEYEKDYWWGCLTCVRRTQLADSATYYIAPNPPARASVADVEIDSAGFNPAYIEVSLGTVVEFTNIDAIDHGSRSTSVTLADDGPGVGAWNSGMLAFGDSFSWQMNTVGTFNYVDPNNPNNIGTVVVSSVVSNVELSEQTTQTSTLWITGAIVLIFTALAVVTVRRPRQS